MRDSEVFVGIDVSKAHLDVGVSRSDGTTTFPNSERGISELREWIAEVSPALVVMETI